MQIYLNNENNERERKKKILTHKFRLKHKPADKSHAGAKETRGGARRGKETKEETRRDTETYNLRRLVT